MKENNILNWIKGVKVTNIKMWIRYVSYHKFSQCIYIECTSCWFGCMYFPYNYFRVQSSPQRITTKTTVTDYTTLILYMILRHTATHKSLKLNFVKKYFKAAEDDITYILLVVKLTANAKLSHSLRFQGFQLFSWYIKMYLLKSHKMRFWTQSHFLWNKSVLLILV